MALALFLDSFLYFASLGVIKVWIGGVGRGGGGGKEGLTICHCHKSVFSIEDLSAEIKSNLAVNVMCLSLQPSNAPLSFSCQDVLDPNRGFQKGDSVILEVRLSAEAPHGVAWVPCILINVAWSVSTDSDCCTFAPKSFGKLTKNAISRLFLSYVKLQCIRVGSMQGSVV